MILAFNSKEKKEAKAKEIDVRIAQAEKEYENTARFLEETKMKEKLSRMGLTIKPVSSFIYSKCIILLILFLFSAIKVNWCYICHCLFFRFHLMGTACFLQFVISCHLWYMAPLM